MYNFDFNRTAHRLTTSNLQNFITRRVGQALVEILSYFAKVFDNHETPQRFALKVYGHHVVTLLNRTHTFNWHVARLAIVKSQQNNNV